MNSSRHLLRRRLWLIVKDLGHNQCRYPHHVQPLYQKHSRCLLHDATIQSIPPGSARTTSHATGNSNSSLDHRESVRSVASGRGRKGLDAEQSSNPKYLHGQHSNRQDAGEDTPRLRDARSSRRHTSHFKKRVKRDIEYKEMTREYEHLFQEERYPDPGGQDWRETLRLLEHGTPDAGVPDLAKRQVVVRSKKGERFVFKAGVGAAVLDIMERTRVHINIVSSPSMDKSGFEQLALWGTSADIKHAVALLPDYVRPLPTGDQQNDQDMQDQSHNNIEIVDGYEPHKRSHEIETPVKGSMSRCDTMYNGLNIQNTSPSSTDTGSSGRKAAPLIRAVWVRSGLPARTGLEPLPRNPPVSSSFELTRQVEDLVDKHPPLAQRMRLRKASTADRLISVSDLVADDLWKLLTDSRNIHSLSSGTLDLALAYLFKNKKHQIAFGILGFLSQHKYALSSSTFVSMCSVASSTGNMRAFHRTVVWMIRQKKPMTPEIWILFIRLVRRRSPDSAVTTIRSHMAKKGLLRFRYCAVRVLQETTSVDLASHMKQPGTDLETFVQWRDQMAKQEFDVDNWLSTSTLNQIIYYSMLRNVDRSKILALIDLFEERRGKVDIVTLNTLLKHALLAESPRYMLQYLQRFARAPLRLFVSNDGLDLTGAREEQKPLILNSRTYNAMFSIAWENKLWNCVRVIWIYACLSGNIYKVMEQKVLHSLMLRGVSPSQNKPSSAQKSVGAVLRSDQIWRRWIGKFVLGLPNLSDLTLSDSNPLSPSLHVEGELVNRAITSDLHEANVQFFQSKLKHLRKLMQTDFSKIGTLTPTLPLLQALRLAYQLDQKWLDVRSKEIVLNAGENCEDEAPELFARMVRDRYDVPLELGDGTEVWSMASGLVRAPPSHLGPSEKEG